ncbi:MAG: hypothetical protein HY827_08675 [Actinobacteria bacterium]|nr:hypothetical protein [Actinomycetota bacterium]
MSNAGLGLRDTVDRDSDDLPRTQSRRTAAQAQARARAAAYERGAPRARAHAPRRIEPSGARHYESGRSRIDADGVRTVKIRGQATPPRRRPLVDVSRPIGRYDQHPDRAAQWALFLGVFMVVVAIVTGS